LLDRPSVRPWTGGRLKTGTPFSDQVRRNLARVDAEPRSEQRGKSDDSQSRRRVEQPAPPNAADRALRRLGRLIRTGDFTHPDSLPKAG
jgi:hypothetical protein